MNKARCLYLIKQAIDTFELDLSGLIILTEAASGYYVLTPLIASLAGAESVLAFTQDSHYGSAKDAYNNTMALATEWGVADQIEILFKRDNIAFKDIDIITNLGFVRPLDASFLQKLGPTASISLMWETWEFRPADLDLSECRRLGIPVLGTNEHHPNLQIFEYIGHLSLKLLFALGIEVFRSSIIVLGSGEFAQKTSNALQASGAEATLIEAKDTALLGSASMKKTIEHADAMVIVEHHNRKMLIGSQGIITVDELVQLNPALAIAHVCGGVDQNALIQAGFQCLPARFALAGHMSVATDWLGPRPLVDLHTAGLKVGERMARVQHNGHNGFEAEQLVLSETSLAQGFADYHD